MAARVVRAAGPWGAGKTTLVRRLARQALAAGESPALVIGELGRLAIDALLLETEGVPVVRWNPSARWEEPAGATLLLVEVPSPHLFDLAGEEAESIRSVLVLDAQRLDLSRPRSFAGADVILLNKSDTRTEDDIARLTGELRRLAPHARTIATVESAANLSELTAGTKGPRRQALLAFEPEAAPSFVEIESAAPLERAAVELLVADPPPGVERAKGIVALADEPGPFLMQITGRSGALRRSVFGAGLGTRLAFFGRDLREEDLRARLRLL